MAKITMRQRFQEWSETTLPPLCVEDLPEGHAWSRSEAEHDWKARLPEVLQSMKEVLQSRLDEFGRLTLIEAEIARLKKAVGRLQQTAYAKVPVQTFAPEPYEIISPLEILLRAEEDEFVATFLDANLSIGGSTEEEAFGNLRDMIIEVFEILSEHDEDRLGPGPKKQLHILKRFIRKVQA